MTKLVWIGPNQANDGGHSSKAYTLRRRGRVVTCRWGPVECRGGRGGRISWLGKGPNTQDRTFATTKDAADFVAKLKAEKIGKGYQQLPWLTRIYPSRPKP
jgi:predicted DNA-binding WGR domain protein